MKTAIFFVRRGGDEMGYAHVHADHWGRDLGLKRNVLVTREREPPDPVALVEHRGRVEAAIFEHFLVIGGEFDRNAKWISFLQGRDAQPVVKGGIFRFLHHDHIGVRLDDWHTQFWEIPFTPLWLFPFGGLFPSLRLGFRFSLGVISQIFQVGFVGRLPIGPPGFGDACRLLYGHPMQAV